MKSNKETSEIKEEQSKKQTKKITEIKSFDERVNELVELGKKEGRLTFEQIAECLKGLDVDSDSLEVLYNRLLEEAIEVVSSTEKTEDGEADKRDVVILSDEDITKDMNINDPVRMYLKEIGRISLLSPQEEADLSIRVSQGDEDAKRELAESNLRLVVSIAKR